MPVSQYREGTELIDVVARAEPEERLKLDALPNLTVITPAGNAVPLSQVATASYEQEEPVRWRRDRETILTVRADVADGVQAPDVTARILVDLEALKAELPPGYRVDTGGAVEESQKANEALFAVFKDVDDVRFGFSAFNHDDLRVENRHPGRYPVNPYAIGEQLLGKRIEKGCRVRDAATIAQGRMNDRMIVARQRVLRVHGRGAC
jgi:hypothetical protein